MADPNQITAEQFKEAARRAVESGDNATARKLIQRAKAAEASAPQEAGGFWDSVYENVVGRGEVDTPGERLGELVRGAGAATARGIADVPAIPANLMQLGAMGVEKALGMDQPSAVSRGLNALPDTRDMLSKVPVIGPESQYEAPGTAGEYVSTIGEFAGGAGAMAGPGAMLKYGALPGAASEAAGQATEGTAIEPYARTAAALAAPSITARSASTARIPGRNPQRVASANNLERAGVRPTAGQATGSDMLRRLEGSVEPSGRQLDNFTKAAMRRIKSTADDARPENLRAAQSNIVNRMDDIISGVDVTVPPAVKRITDSALRQYNRHVTSGNRAKVFEKMADELSSFAQNPNKPVPLSQLRMWRRDIGKLTTSTDDATREAAHSFRNLIDRLTDRGLRSAGRADDIPALKEARSDYRNYLAVEDAATRAGAEGGTISPTQLNQAIIRTQGRKNYATGRGTDLMSLSRDAVEHLRPLPSVSAGGVRGVQGAAPVGGAGIGYYLGGIPGAAAGAAAPLLGQGLLRSPAMQNAIKNPATAMKPLPGMLPGLLNQ